MTKLSATTTDVWGRRCFVVSLLYLSITIGMCGPLPFFEECTSVGVKQGLVGLKKKMTKFPPPATDLRHLWQRT